MRCDCNISNDLQFHVTSQRFLKKYATVTIRITTLTRPIDNTSISSNEGDVIEFVVIEFVEDVVVDEEVVVVGLIGSELVVVGLVEVVVDGNCGWNRCST